MGREYARVNIRVCACADVGTYVCARLGEYVRVYVCVCMCACARVCEPLRMCACVRACVCVWACACARTRAECRIVRESMCSCTGYVFI